MTVGLCLLGILAGVLAQYALRQNLLGCLVCSLAALSLIGLFRIVYHLANRTAGLPALLAVALPEILWSMVFVLPVYGLYLWVFRRVPKKTVL